MFVRRLLALVVLAVGLLLAVAGFWIGAPVAAGAEPKEPVGVVCVDPWVADHPGDHEPAVNGHWSWWPPGITCTHASGEVYVEPSARDAVEVATLGLLVLLLGVAPTVLVAWRLWRGRPAGPRPGTS